VGSDLRKKSAVGPLIFPSATAVCPRAAQRQEPRSAPRAAEEAPVRDGKHPSLQQRRRGRVADAAAGKFNVSVAIDAAAAEVAAWM